MKRVLSWLVLAVCYFVLCVIANLDVALLKYLIGLYSELSAFLKLVIIILGGSFFAGLAIAPALYGVPLTVALCEKIHPSKKGARYIVFGIFVLLCCLFEAITTFMLRDILIGIYGIALIITGANIAKGKSVYR